MSSIESLLSFLRDSSPPKTKFLTLSPTFFIFIPLRASSAPLHPPHLQHPSPSPLKPSPPSSPSPLFTATAASPCLCLLNRRTSSFALGRHLSVCVHPETVAKYSASSCEITFGIFLLRAPASTAVRRATPLPPSPSC